MGKVERNKEYVHPILGAILLIGGLYLLALGIIIYNIQNGGFNFHIGPHVIYEIVGISLTATIVMAFGIYKILLFVQNGWMKNAVDESTFMIDSEATKKAYNIQTEHQKIVIPDYIKE